MKRLIDADIAGKRIRKILDDYEESRERIKVDHETALRSLEERLRKRIENVLTLYETEYDETQKLKYPMDNPLDYPEK